MELNIPHPILCHQKKESKATVKLIRAKISTIHGRYLPIFVKRVSKDIIASSFAVLGIALVEGEDGSFSDMQ